MVRFTIVLLGLFLSVTASADCTKLLVRAEEVPNYVNVISKEKLQTALKEMKAKHFYFENEADYVRYLSKRWKKTGSAKSLAFVMITLRAYVEVPGSVVPEVYEFQVFDTENLDKHGDLWYRTFEEGFFEDNTTDLGSRYGIVIRKNKNSSVVRYWVLDRETYRRGYDDPDAALELPKSESFLIRLKK